VALDKAVPEGVREYQQQLQQELNNYLKEKGNSKGSKDKKPETVQEKKESLVVAAPIQQQPTTPNLVDLIQKNPWIAFLSLLIGILVLLNIFGLVFLWKLNSKIEQLMTGSQGSTANPNSQQEL
jgi:hypothetical protein